MSERKINLAQILNNIYDEKYRSNYKTDYSEQCILEAMKEAIKQTLELAAENADLNYCEYEWEVPEGTINTGDSQYGYHYIDKQSILNTIKQIE